MNCDHCLEPILDSEPSERVLGEFGGRWHRECQVRVAVGSIGHQLGLCACPGNPRVLDDPPLLTARGAARVAYAYWLALQSRRDPQPWKKGVNGCADQT